MREKKSRRDLMFLCAMCWTLVAAKRGIQLVLLSIANQHKVFFLKNVILDFFKTNFVLIFLFFV